MKHKDHKRKEYDYGLISMRILTVLFLLSFVTLIVVDLGDVSLSGKGVKKTGFAFGDPEDNFDEEWNLYLQAKSAYDTQDLEALNLISYEQYSLEDYNLSESEETEFWNMLSNFSNYCDLQREDFVNIERDSKQSIISTNFSINESIDYSRDAHKSYIYFLKNDTDSLKILMIGCYIGVGFYDNSLNNTELDIKLQSMILDSDNDDLTDYKENCSGSNEYNPNCIETDSYNKDTDEDGWWDSIELKANTDPTNSLDFPYNELINEHYCNNNSICESGENSTNCGDCECEYGDSRSCGTDVGICNTGLEQCTEGGNWSGICDDEVVAVNETCNNQDDDCDGLIDEGFDYDGDGEINDNETFDYDGDGYVPNRTIVRNLVCSGYNEDMLDCDDEDNNINPGELESYNDIDDDCDGLIDENFNVTEFNYSAERSDLGILKENGSYAYLREQDWATFKLGDYFAKVEVSDLTDNSINVLLTMLSGFDIEEFNSINLDVGDSTTYDLNNDGVDDISVLLESIQNSFKAYLLIKPIGEIIIPVCNDNLICESGETLVNCPSDCLIVEVCDNNGICENEETIKNCPSDCMVVEEPVFKEEGLPEEFAPVQWECNNNDICEGWESKDDCPTDCTVDYLKYIKEISLIAGTIFILLTLTFGSAYVKSQVNPYGVNKKLRGELIKSVEKGLNMNNIAYYLSSKKYKEGKIKKSLKYAHDFTILKRAAVFYLAQGQKEGDVKKICKKNRWSSRMIKDVFKDISDNKAKFDSFTRVHSVRKQGKYNINAFNKK